MAQAKGTPLSPVEEAKTIRGLWKDKLEENETWFVLDQKWFKNWCVFTGFNPKGTVDGTPGDVNRPDAIDNTPILEENNLYALKKDISEGLDYVLVNKEAWEQLQKWYGGGPVLDRHVFAIGGLLKETRVDLFPVFLTMKTLNQQGEPDDTTTQVRRFTRRDTFEDVLKKLNEELKTTTNDEEKKASGEEKAANIRLWMKEEKKDDKGQVTGDKWVIIRDGNLSAPLDALQLPPSVVIWIEKKHEGNWVRSPVKKNFREYEVNDIVDCCDTQNKWYESTIRKIDQEKKQVHVHFNGWSEKWDEWLAFDSERIAMQNTHTTGPYVARSSGGYGGDWSWGSNEEGTPSVVGGVGLRNLGNTCFMNSTLQCLSNTPGLTQYFVSRKFMEDLNRDNPLGWRGRIAEEYGALLQDMWGNKYRVVAPSKFKQVLGEFQPRFSGYQQQDSSELLSFLLDGLHEDLNQVKKKPVTKAVESNGRPDAEIAKEAWDTYLLRNKSVIVNTFQGQLRSTVVCPECKRLSITFDPYMFLSVPLPQIVDKVQQLFFVSADPTKPLMQIFPMVPKIAMMTELRVAIGKLMGVPDRRLVIADVWRGRIHRFFEDDDSVSDIRLNDTVYVYEVPELDDPKSKPFAIPNYVLDGNKRSDAVAFPLVIGLPRDQDLTTGLIRERIERASKFLTKQEHGTDLYSIIMVDSHGSYCVKCDFTSNCSGCELPSENIPLSKIETRYRMSLGVQWNNGGAAIDAGKIKAIEHESAKAAKIEQRQEPTLEIADCVQSFTKQEVLGENDAWYCSKCKKHQQASKKFDIWTLPEILIIHLKRFSYTRYNRDKINTFVDFPIDDLDMRSFVDNPDIQDTKYELYAVSNHMGGMGGGHYTAYAKNLSDHRWYTFDDSHVHPVDRPDQIKSSSAYVLFYARKKSIPKTQH